MEKYLFIIRNYDFEDCLAIDYACGGATDLVDEKELHKLVDEFLTHMALKFVGNDPDIPNVRELSDALIEENNWVIDPETRV